MKDLKLADFPLQAYDKLRYADTDRQGHVNNAVFSTFLETGRVEFIYHEEFPTLSDGTSFVIASLELKFMKEIIWPGKVEIGTGLLSMGRSSIKLFQRLFQNEQCVGEAETVIVQVKDGKGLALSDASRSVLAKWILPQDIVAE